MEKLTLKMTTEATEEQLLYARILEKGMLVGLVLLEERGRDEKTQHDTRDNIVQTMPTHKSRIGQVNLAVALYIACCRGVRAKGERVARVVADCVCEGAHYGHL